MEEYRSAIVLTSVGIYMAMCVAIGLWALRRTKTTRDFFMAGRDLGIIVTAAAVFSSTMSGFGFVGGPGLVYRMGMSSLWMIVCVTIGYGISFFLLGKKLRLFAELCDSISLPDVVAARYRSETARFGTALAILLGVVFYLGVQILAMATVLRELLASNESIGEVSLETCMLISGAVLVFYCVTGGIVASVYTDVIQGFVMMVAAVLVFLTAATAVEGGFGGMTRTMMADQPEAIMPWGTLGMLGALSWYFLFALGGAGQPHVITKLMMLKRVEDAKYTLPISLIGYTVSALLWISIGLAVRTLVLQGDLPPLADADSAAPVFLQRYANPLLAGVVFAGLFAAIMSTADAFLNIGVAAIVHDMPKALRGRPLSNELFWARMFTVILAIVAGVAALYSGDLIAILGALAWGIFAAALVPTVAIGFNWKRATPMAANVAIFASLGVNFAIRIASQFLGITIPYGIDGGAIALLVSLTLFFGISLFSKPPKLDPDIEEVMDL